MQINKQLNDFVNKHTNSFPKHLAKMQQEAYEEGLPIIDKDIADFLATLLTLKQPKNILEVGCAVGFSSVLFASFAPHDSKITTIDRYEFMVNRAKINFKKLNLEHKVELIADDAINVLPKLLAASKKYDFIFLDAAKGQYINFLQYILPLLTENGLFVADNIFQNGDISLEINEIEKRNRTIYRNMHRFLHSVFENTSLVSSVLPIGDGLLVSSKKCHGVL